jgi:hypothetical protein
MTLPAQVSPRVAALLKKTRASRGRLIFALDATASREATWDLASQLTADMVLEAAKIGGLDIQLLYYRGHDEVQAVAWSSDAYELVTRMRAIRCDAGATKIARILHHIRAEHARERINATVFVGDAIEEPPGMLYDAARGLSVPVFWFHEGDGLAAARCRRVCDRRNCSADQSANRGRAKAARPNEIGSAHHDQRFNRSNAPRSDHGNRKCARCARLLRRETPKPAQTARRRPASEKRKRAENRTDEPKDSGET